MRELAPYSYVAKGGGTTGANFKEIDEGYYGAICREDVSRPQILVPSAPGKEPGKSRSRKLTHHAADALDAIRNGNKVAFDRNFEAISGRFLKIVKDANLDEPKFQMWLEFLEGAMRFHVAHEGLQEVIMGLILEDYIPDSIFIWPVQYGVVDQYGRISGEKMEKKVQKIIRDHRSEDGSLNKTLIMVPHNALDSRGHLVNMTRGCGDAVASNFAKATKLPVIIFQGTDGIGSADPVQHPQLKVRKRMHLSCTEAHTATQGGVYAVHIEGIRPIEQADGTLEVRHYRKSDQRGTIVTRKRHPRNEESSPRIVTGEVGSQTLNLVKRGGVPEDELAQRVSSALVELGIPVKALTADAYGAFVLLDEGAFPKAEKNRLRKMTGVDSVEIEEGMGLISVVGVPFVRNGALGKLGTVLDGNVEYHRFSETGRGSGYSFSVSIEDFEPTLVALHQELVEADPTETDPLVNGTSPSI